MVEIGEVARVGVASESSTPTHVLALLGYCWAVPGVGGGRNVAMEPNPINDLPHCVSVNSTFVILLRHDKR